MAGRFRSRWTRRRRKARRERSSTSSRKVRTSPAGLPTNSASGSFSILRLTASASTISTAPIVEFSPSFANMLGYGRDEIKALNIANINADKTATELRASFRQLAQSDEARTIETRHRRRDGSAFDVEVSVKAIELSGKSYIYSASRDITKRKRDEQALSESRTLRESVFTPLPTARPCSIRTSIASFATRITGASSICLRNCSTKNRSADRPVQVPLQPRRFRRRRRLEKSRRSPF